MDISITTCNNWQELSDFLKEWTGKSYNPSLHIVPMNMTYLVARDRDNGNKIVGCAGFIKVGDPFFDRCWAMVENVYITPVYRNKGIGADLMRAIEANLFIGDEIEFLKLTTRKDLGRKLYRSLGYEEGSSFYKSR